MKIIILGQPRNGKTTLAEMLSRKLDIPLLSTDKYRHDWGFHEPWKGYKTEIAPDKQHLFYEKIRKIYDNHPDIIVEGNAIHPKDISFFTPDVAVLLARLSVTPNEYLKTCRIYDNNEWTNKRSDEYLLKLFGIYTEFSKKWVNEFPDLFVDTSEFHRGLAKAENIILNRIKEKWKNNLG